MSVKKPLTMDDPHTIANNVVTRLMADDLEGAEKVIRVAMMAAAHAERGRCLRKLRGLAFIAQGSAESDETLPRDKLAFEAIRRSLRESANAIVATAYDGPEGESDGANSGR